MAQSPDHPELRFVQARYYARGRPNGEPLWIVVHDMEAGEHSDRAENTAEYFRTMPDGRVVSSHYCADNNSVIQCVRLGDVAYTVGNTAGNYRGINWEFAGFARQTREQWLDDFGVAMFRQAAPYIRADAEKYGIPLKRCSVDDLKARRKGITSHNDLRLAYGGTTHTDPGPNFPWDEFMAIIQEDDVSAQDVWKWDPNDPKTGVRNQPFNSDAATNPTVEARYALERAWYESHYANERVGKLSAMVDVLGAKVDAIAARPPVDPAALQLAVEAALQNPSVAAVLAKANADEQARRLAE
ncbi:MAG TPA: N-acetylmuramoyl-L-alanine amidase [Micromonosporaceae bacterium]